MASEYVLKEGNPNVMLCERGIRTFETAYRFTLDLLACPRFASSPICRWSSTRVTLRAVATGYRPMSLAAAAAGADGIIVEVHNDPENAICDGPQALSTADFADYAEQLRRVAELSGARRRLSRAAVGGGP